ncbi:MAG: hydroxymethylbilane synthase [Acidimicrobiales bacterium]
MTTLRAATRASALARWQTDYIAALLGDAHADLTVEPVVIDTQGDRDKTSPIHQLGGQGVFVKEVQAAVLDGRADVAVHSAKDLPSAVADGLVIAAVPERADERDVLIGSTFADLAPGAVVATGSVRRRAQLAWARPDLRFAELRGNIGTRLAKAADFDAIVMAAAALDRLGEHPAVAERLPVDVMLPQVAQGALAVECREDDAATRERLAAIEHVPSRRRVDAERSFLAELGGGCDLPAGALAILSDEGIELTGLLATTDGAQLLRATAVGADTNIGADVARHLLDGGGRQFE